MEESLDARSRVDRTVPMTRSTTLRVLVADDHALFREGLVALLATLADEVTVHQARSVSNAIDIIRSCPLDLALIDVMLPDASGIECLRQLTLTSPATPAVMLSASEDGVHVQLGLDGGAQAYVHKSVSGATLLGVLRQVLAGEVDGLVVGLGGTPEAGHPLTPRQVQVLSLLAEGRSNKDIARALSITLNTVRVHLACIYRSLGVSNRTEAVVRALQLGVVGAVS